MKKILLVTAFAVALGAANSASATVLFFDDFNDGLSSTDWITAVSASTHGQVVDDPLSAGHGKVLNFHTVDAYGDLFSTQLIDITAGVTYTVEFDYYGTSDGGNTSGGFAGLATGVPPGNSSNTGDHVWYAGTITNSLSDLEAEGHDKAITLEDDKAEWYHIAYTFTAPFLDITPLRLIFEDFSGAGSLAGNAYFDNVKFSDNLNSGDDELTAVPVPAALPLFGTGLAFMGYMGWRRKRKQV